MLEKQIQQAIIEYLGYRHDLYFFRSGSGAVKTADGRYFKTGKKGCPDVTVCYKGYFIGLEIKSEKGKQKPEQKEAENQITKSGGFYFIVRSVDDVINVLKNINDR